MAIIATDNEATTTKTTHPTNTMTMAHTRSNNVNDILDDGGDATMAPSASPRPGLPDVRVRRPQNREGGGNRMVGPERWPGRFESGHTRLGPDP